MARALTGAAYPAPYRDLVGAIGNPPSRAARIGRKGIDMSEQNHAIGNANAWLGTIRDIMAGIRKLESGAESVTVDGETFDDADALRDRIQEQPLSVQVRSAWHNPGAEGVKPAEFEILLSTGGPALRLIGDLDEYGQPESAALEWQDWGTPWTRLPVSDKRADDLRAYAATFYFGE